MTNQQSVALIVTPIILLLLYAMQKYREHWRGRQAEIQKERKAALQKLESEEPAIECNVACNGDVAHNFSNCSLCGTQEAQPNRRTIHEFILTHHKIKTEQRLGFPAGSSRIVEGWKFECTRTLSTVLCSICEADKALKEFRKNTLAELKVMSITAAVVAVIFIVVILLPDPPFIIRIIAAVLMLPGVIALVCVPKLVYDYMNPSKSDAQNVMHDLALKELYNISN